MAILHHQYGADVIKPFIRIFPRRRLGICLFNPRGVGVPRAAWPGRHDRARLRRRHRVPDRGVAPGQAQPARPILIGTAGTRRPWAAVAAATALNAPLGSLYAFSVFLQPLEALLGLSRTDLALVFGLASVGFSAGMNLAPYVYRLASNREAGRPAPP
jgi:hypothetical protein